METSENLWIAVVIALAVGFIVGIIVTRLAPRLKYQQEVASHFNTTASLVTRLNRSYHDIQEHLGQAAVELAPDDMTRQRLLAALEQEAEPDSRDRIEPVFDTLEPPRDYADKPEEGPGTLSEEFGVKRT